MLEKKDRGGRGEGGEARRIDGMQGVIEERKRGKRKESGKHARCL